MDNAGNPQVYAYAFEPSIRTQDSKTAIITQWEFYVLKWWLRWMHLPRALILLRRLQLFPTTPTSVILATFPPPRPNLQAKRHANFPKRFALGFFDRTAYPAVEAWAFTHLEANPAEPSPEDSAAAAYHLLALFKHFAASPFASVQSAMTGEAVDGKDHLTFGAVSERLRTAMTGNAELKHLMRDDLYSPGGPYRKFVFPLEGFDERLRLAKVPDGLEWGEVVEGDYSLVLESNSIMTIPAMIHALPSACLRETGGSMVAWGFLGPDGCVRALFCKEKWRGKGLARMIVLKLHSLPLMTEVKDGVDFKMDDRLGHADASEDNTGSVRLFKSLGAQEHWNYYWIRLDLTRLLSDGQQ